VSAGWQATPGDEALLETLGRRAVRYFTDHSDPATGLTRDRAPKDGSPSGASASIAATGFALTAWCIADARDWIAPGEALHRVRTTLRFAADRVEHEHGWFYHFVDPRTGRRAGASEASTIDTALFLQGAILAREYLHDPETTRLVDRIYSRVDWRWALDGGQTLTHGWRPESGFIPHRWSRYSELMGLYLLGIGAPANALPASSWTAWHRGPRGTIDGREFFKGGPLFTHQYAQAWFDFRGLRDAYADYWQNSVDATLAQRAWFAAHNASHPQWQGAMWGLTASDSATGYRAWGTPGNREPLDGTVVPCAPGGSLPFAPEECLAALRAMRDAGGAGVWGRYGFVDAFNPSTGWTGPDVIGIDVGITLVMTENLRSGLVWRSFMCAPEVQRAMLLAGFAARAAPGSS
jgi:hypothetical protein